MRRELTGPAEEPVELEEVKRFLRIEHGAEDALLVALIRSARDACEASMGQLMIERAMAETLALRDGAAALTAGPVIAVQTVEAIGADGSAVVLAAADWRMRPARDGSAQVEAPGPGDMLRVTYRAGLAGTAAALPPALRQAVLRMVAHLWAHRDGAGAEGMPLPVIALMRPFRRLRLG